MQKHFLSPTSDFSKPIAKDYLLNIINHEKTNSLSPIIIPYDVMFCTYPANPYSNFQRNPYSFNYKFPPNKMSTASLYAWVSRGEIVEIFRFCST
jgi:hypothetical protein